MSTEATDHPVTGFPPRLGTLGIVLGILTGVLGVLALVWPGQTLLVLAILFGLQLLLVGGYRLVGAVTSRSAPGWWRGFMGVFGALTAIAGIICVFRPGASLLVIAILIAIGWIADGATSIVGGIVDRRESRHRVLQIVFGIISILAAIVILVWPAASLLLMTAVGGTLLIILGVVIVVVAVIARSANRSGTTPTG